MNRLKELRKAKKLTQKELAEKTDIPYRTLQRWENGETDIKSDKAQELADFFGVHVPFLLGYSPIRTAEEEISMMIDDFNNDFIEFLKPHIELDVATIEPAQYEPILEKLELNVFEVEDDYSVPIQKRITGKEVDINVRTRPLYTEKKVIVSDIIVYSRNSYAEARKIALQVYKEYLEKVRNNPEATEFYGQPLIYNADNPNGL